MADEITIKIVKQLRDALARLDAKFDARSDELNRRMDAFDERQMVVEHILRDVHGHVLILNRRVTKLEKKAS